MIQGLYVGSHVSGKSCLWAVERHSKAREGLASASYRQGVCGLSSGAQRGSKEVFACECCFGRCNVPMRSEGNALTWAGQLLLVEEGRESQVQPSVDGLYPPPIIT